MFKHKQVFFLIVKMLVKIPASPFKYPTLCSDFSSQYQVPVNADFMKQQVMMAYIMSPIGDIWIEFVCRLQLSSTL